MEIMRHNGENVQVTVMDMLDEDKNHIESCPHSKQKFYVCLGTDLNTFEIIRTKQE